MKYLSLFIGIMLLLHSSSFAQEYKNNIETDYARNTLSVAVGILPYFGIVNSLGYERNLLIREGKFLNSIWIKGRASLVEFNFPWLDFSVSSLLGRGNNKLELGIGIGS